MRKQITTLAVCLLALAGCMQRPSPAPAVPAQTEAASPSPILTPAFPTFADFPTELLVRVQPASCGVTGSSGYSEPPIDVAGFLQYEPSSMVLERGTVLIVTNNGDEINGDTSSTGALVQKPGADGISLREALSAVQSEPGEHTIRFDPGLKGTTIEVGSWDGSELPAIGSSLILNGDVDGDGNADISLENDMNRPGQNTPAFGLYIHSSHTTVHAVRFVDFTNAIYYDSPFHDQVMAENTLSHLVIEGGNGIVGGSGNEAEYNNTWSGIRIIGNTIRARGGISLGMTNSSGNRFENLVIADNLIEINAENDADAFDGIMLSSGAGPHSSNNEIQNAVIANNTVTGNPYVGIGLSTGSLGAGGNSLHHVSILNNTVDMYRQDILASFGLGISAGYWVNQEGNQISDILVADNSFTGRQESVFFVASGTVGSSHNRLERFYITNNHIKVVDPVRENGAPNTAVSIVTGDGATDYADPSYLPVVYPNDNLVQDVWISNNVIEGQGGQAVSLGTGDPGSEDNQIRSIYIVGNDIDGYYPASGFMISAISLYLGGINNNIISQVFIQHNSIKQANLRGSFSGEEFASGAIILTAGNGTRRSMVQEVWISNNEINSPAPGITILGGVGNPGGSVTQENQIKDVQVWCNAIPQEPALLQAVFPEVKGINLAGGFALAKNNSVSNVILHANLVAGRMDDVSVYQNAGDGSEANSVTYQIP